MQKIIHAALLMLVVCGVAATNASAQSDTLPPQLTGVSIAPSNVDVTSAGATITISLTVTDDLAGIDLSTSNRLQLVIGLPGQVGGGLFAVVPQPSFPPVLAGTFQIAAFVPRWALPGEWAIRRVQLRDNAGNESELDTADLLAAGLPAHFTVTDANPDLELPQLAGVSISPSRIVDNSVPVDVTVDVRLTDDKSGIGTGLLSLPNYWLESPSGQQRRLFDPVYQRMPVAGTLTDGTWRAVVRMPPLSEPGVWRLGRAEIIDRTFKDALYDATDIAALFGSDAEFLVGDGPGAPDVTPPVVEDLGLGDVWIDTSSGPQTVLVTPTISDAQSGVSWAQEITKNLGVPEPTPSFGIEFRSPSGAQRIRAGLVFGSPVPVLLSGDVHHGEWAITVNFPQSAEQGTWRVSGILLKDETRNLRLYTGADAAAFGGSVTVLRPSGIADGAISDSSVPSVVTDATFGDRASLTVPAGTIPAGTAIAIDVLESPIRVPAPASFSSAETYFVNINLAPEPSFPLPAPGVTLTMPLRTFVIPGTAIHLFTVDFPTNTLVPALDASGNPIVGMADAGGFTATFAGVSHFSVYVGFLPDAVPVEISIRPRVIHARARGTVVVVIHSTPTLDVSAVQGDTLRFSGAAVRLQKKGKVKTSTADMNGDGRLDLVARFDVGGLLLVPGDTEAVVEGVTLDGRGFRGTADVTIR